MLKHGHLKAPFLLVHGGAGPQDPTGSWLEEATAAIIKIAQQAHAQMITGVSSITTVVDALRAIEDHPHFNAGYGATLQEDGVPRLTAAVMDGNRQSFSGVINITNTRNPSLMAAALQGESSRVLAPPGCELLARRLGLPVESLLTERRLERWAKKTLSDMAKDTFDTVGCVVWDGNDLAAGTSTGGRGFEFPGRVSDAGSVAGNYASHWAALSATGIGEEIIDDALCARVETRVRDGMTLKHASEKAFQEASDRQRLYGWIGCDRSGHWVVAHTTPTMTFAVIDAEGRVAASS